MTSNSLQWIASNYVRLHGLRNWTWRQIIDGIVFEHRHHIKQKYKGKSNVRTHHLEGLWETLLDIAGIQHLNEVP